LHIWPRGGFMMIALPNQDRSFTCTCFWPFSTFESLKTPQDVETFFCENFPDAISLMPTLIDDYQQNPVGSLVTIRCHPWYVKNKVVLVGDAAHAIVPFYGQGMNAAFEDCVILSETIRMNVGGQPLEAFNRTRKLHTDAIAEMALHNFVEMRDHTASRWFLLLKKFEHLLHRLFPRQFVPLYNLISFTTVPYAFARKRWKMQVRN